MELCDRKPVKEFLDRSKKLYFKVVQTDNGLFNLYESRDKEKWNVSRKNLTLNEVMEIQSVSVNSNILNYINFLSIIKGKDKKNR